MMNSRFGGNGHRPNTGAARRSGGTAAIRVPETPKRLRRKPETQQPPRWFVGYRAVASGFPRSSANRRLPKTLPIVGMAEEPRLISRSRKNFRGRTLVHFEGQKCFARLIVATNHTREHCGIRIPVIENAAAVSGRKVKPWRSFRWASSRSSRVSKVDV
jgi:hypothetical protein